MARSEQGKSGTSSHQDLGKPGFNSCLAASQLSDLPASEKGKEHRHLAKVSGITPTPQRVVDGPPLPPHTHTHCAPGFSPPPCSIYFLKHVWVWESASFQRPGQRTKNFLLSTVRQTHLTHGNPSPQSKGIQPPKKLGTNPSSTQNHWN